MTQYEIPYPETIADRNHERIPFDPVGNATHRKFLDRVISKWKTLHPDAQDAQVDVIDEDRRMVILHSASVASVKRDDAGAIRVNLLPEQCKPNKGREVAAAYERKFPGFHLTEFHPYESTALLERMSDRELTARGLVCEYVGCDPWNVKIKEHDHDEGFSLSFLAPFVFRKEPDQSKLDGAAVAIGHVGWWSQVDARTGEGDIIPGEPPTFPKTVPFDFDALHEPGSRDRAPFGVKPARPGETAETAFVDWTQSPGLLVAGLSGGGKAQPLDARIPVPVSDRFPDGWATMGTLQVGDPVYAPDGSTVPIKGFSDTVMRDVWEVEFSDGQIVECADDHLWTVHDGPARRRKPDTPGDRRLVETRLQVERLRHAAGECGPDEWASLPVIMERYDDIRYSSAKRIAVEKGLEWRGHEVNVRDLLLAVADERERMCKPDGVYGYHDGVTVTTRYLAEHLRRKNGESRWAVHVTQPVQGGTVHPLPLHPYVFGCWLGDGISRTGAICLNDWDAVFMEPVIEHEGRLVVRRRELNGGHCVTRHYNTADGTSLHMLLKHMNVLADKHIPAEYLRADLGDRLALLQGLLDTDGSIDARGGVELSLTNRRLAMDAVELIRSLGIKTSVHESDATVTDPDGSRRIVGRRWRITFTTGMPVFRLPRKRDRLPDSTRSVRDWLYVRDVRHTSRRTPMRCIRLGREPNLYLTGGFIPTHNSVTVNDIIASGVASGVELYLVDHVAKASDFNWVRPWVAPHGWGADSLLQACGLLKRLLDDISDDGARTRAWREHGWQNWYDDLSDEDKREYPLRLIVVDELSQIAVGGKDASAIPKNPLPAVMERMIEQQVIALNLSSLIKISQIGRAYGYRLIVATQLASSTTGMPPALRGNLGNKLIMGARANPAQRKLIFNDASSVPTVPSNVFDEGVSKGVGVAEFEGQEPFVFKSAFPLLGQHAGTAALGEALVDLVGLPDGFTRDEYLSSLDKSTPVDADYERRIRDRVAFDERDTYRLYPFLRAMKDKLDEVSGDYDDGGDGPAAPSPAPVKPDGANPSSGGAARSIPSEGLLDARELARVMEGRD